MSPASIVGLCVFLYCCIGFFAGAFAEECGEEHSVRVGVFWFPLLIKWLLRNFWIVVFSGWRT